MCVALKRGVKISLREKGGYQNIEKGESFMRLRLMSQALFCRLLQQTDI